MADKGLPIELAELIDAVGHDACTVVTQGMGGKDEPTIVAECRIQPRVLVTLKEYRYTITLHLEPEEGGYSVTVPALPGCLAQGETLEEAIAMAKEAIAVHIQGLIEDNEPVPQEEETLTAIVKVAA